MPDTLSPLQEIARDLRADREALRAAVDSVPAALRGTRPTPDRWSVAEILEHILIVEKRTAKMIALQLEQTPPRDPSSSARTPFDRLAMRDRTQRFNAPEFVQPTSGSGDADAAWAALEQSWVGLDALLERADDRDLSAIGRDHPALGPLDGYQWLTSLGGHELRHAAQIREIGEALGTTS